MPEASAQVLFEEIVAGADGVAIHPTEVRESDAVQIIYTSGTSGEAKGVVLTAANVGFMLESTSARLDQLMEGRAGQDRILHYLPLSFAASWIALLTFLKRRSLVILILALSMLANDMRVLGPDSFFYVPQLLERMRRAGDEQLQ